MGLSRRSCWAFVHRKEGKGSGGGWVALVLLARIVFPASCVDSARVLVLLGVLGDADLVNPTRVDRWGPTITASLVKSKFYRHNVWRASFVCCLICSAPGTNSIPDMTASEFDLGIVTHGEYCFDILRTSSQKRIVMI